MVKSEHQLRDEEREKIFLSALSEDSIDKTVSDILIGLIGKTTINIHPIHRLNYGYHKGPDIVAAYKDGIALCGERSFSDGSGNLVDYILHRNNEQVAYFLDILDIDR